ncbi:MAG TPA: response regulator [Pirellulales bacterium]|jgi:CheY-like chemotaxis protein/PAS domain-containing protein|nr:response regulator [Pirellulales bacterium]
MPKLLIVADHQAEQADGADAAAIERLGAVFEIVQVPDSMLALGRLAREEFAGVYIAGGFQKDAATVGGLLQNERILQGMPDGVVLLDSDNTILWGNGRLREWCNRDIVMGANFYSVLGSPEILGPDFCPFHTALATSNASSSTLRSSDNRYYRVHAAPVLEAGGPPKNLIVTIRDVTAEVLQQQKLAAIHQAGVELADLAPDELSRMTVEERKELLKANILHYTQDLLNFNVVEIRLLDSKTGRLEPLLYEGIVPEAAERVLYPKTQGNGVTGFVAATGQSYLCEDTTEDPLYLEGAKGAKSSLTVPLVLHDQVIGTFNVESPEPRAFTENDLQFLEIFSRDVAASINTLELLVAQEANAAAGTIDAVHSAVALPVDEILNDAVNIMERYIGHEPEVTERIKRILRNARDIKQVIQKVGQQMAPTEALPTGVATNDRPELRGLKVLVVDTDEAVRSQSHALLDRYGCVVETAHDGTEAVSMVRAMSLTDNYDVIITDIRLPDTTGYELLMKLAQVIEHVPIVLMTGFGYDPGHSIPNAKRAGFSPVLLYKPFSLDQLLNAVEQVMRQERPVRQS